MVELFTFSEHRLVLLTVVVCFLCLNLISCVCLNDEGLSLLRFKERVVSDPFGALGNWNDDAGDIYPCSWYGVGCSEGNVVALNLRDLCLEGTVAPDLGKLFHMKAINLRNNSFSGIIPQEIGKLTELEVLDLGYNNFSGLLPAEIDNNLLMATILLDNNELLVRTTPESHELKMLSVVHAFDNKLSDPAERLSWRIVRAGDAARRRLPEAQPADLPRNKIRPASLFSPSLILFHAPPLPPSLDSPQSSPSPSPSPSPLSPTIPGVGAGIGETASGPAAFDSPPLFSAPSLSPSEIPTFPSSSPKHHHILILSAVIGVPVLLLILVIGMLFCQSNKVAVVKPWVTGLSGQLQKAFVTGVPKLKRSELETACEDFSNVIGSSSIGTLYKGTLSSGVEIAVISLSVTSAKDWSKNLESKFRKKIDMLSKVNHKNFVSLLGYCDEAEPFTRMMVFEYAPNGNLFEHLHIKEAEHLDWAMRMRIVMGIAYCLEHLHQLAPPITHKDLNSSAIFLTEDYAAKISDFTFWDDTVAAEKGSNAENNVYSFGVLLFEMVTGRLPYSVNSSSLEDWASDYLTREQEQPIGQMLDPTLRSFEQDQLERIGRVMRSCVDPDPKQRPGMKEVAAKLRDITGIGPDGAIPRLSPLWWAELEILSTEAP